MDPEDFEWTPPSETEMKLMQARRERSDRVSKLMSNYLLKGYKMLANTCPKCDTILLQDRQGVNYCVACSELDSDTTKDDPVICESAAISMAKELELASAAAAAGSTVVTTASAPCRSTGAMTATRPVMNSANFVTESSPHQSQFNSSEDKPSSLGRMDISIKEEPTTQYLTMSSIDVQCYTADTPRSTVDTPRYASDTPRYTAGPSEAQISPRVSSKSNMKRNAGIDSGISSTTLKGQTSPGTRGSGDHIRYAVDESIHIQRLIEKIEWASSELAGSSSVEYSIQLCQLMKAASKSIVALRQARV